MDQPLKTHSTGDIVQLPARSRRLRPAVAKKREVPAVSASAFLEAMRASVSGVNIVTTDGPGGRFGLTVSSFASVSADPPMVLVCINRKSPVRRAIEENGCFCINLLGTGQRSLADRFAGRPDKGEPYDFGTARWSTTATGALRLALALAGFDCTLEEAVHAGSHVIFIGRIVDLSHRPGESLIYTRQSYRRPCRLQPEFNPTGALQ